MDSGDGGGESWQWNDRETDSGGEDDAEDEHTEDGGPFEGVRWFMRTDEEWVVFVREVVSSLAIVAAVGLLLFGISGLWPPMVAIESGSMAPNLEQGDLVFVMEEHRLAGDAAINGTGIVPSEVGAAVGYTEFNKYGDVIVYHRNGEEQLTPIIHRARFWVSEGENWYDEANQSFLAGAENCEELANCPAEHAGFITKGDNNDVYDQVDTGGYKGPISGPVKPEWIVGTAEFRIPWLGEIRLFFGRIATISIPTNATGTTAMGTGGLGRPVAFAGVGAVQTAS